MMRPMRISVTASNASDAARPSKHQRPGRLAGALRRDTWRSLDRIFDQRLRIEAEQRVNLAIVDDVAVRSDLEQRSHAAFFPGVRAYSAPEAG